MTVLVLARDLDPTADAVVTELTERGVPVFRTDLAAFPQRLWLDARLRHGSWSGRLWNDHREVRLEDIRAIWQRSPSGYRVDARLPADEREYCHREARLGLGGVLAALDVLYANHPNRCADAVFKPYQWVTAAACGLAVSTTTITNDPDTARAFVGTGRDSGTDRDTEPGGEFVAKALGPAGTRRDGQTRLGFTCRVTGADLADPAAVSATATTLQRFVPKSHEVRLTAIGSELFGAAIHAGSAPGRIDWRSDPEQVRIEPVDVPEAVADGVRAYLRRAGLVYAGFDFVVTPDGEWVMLEANTSPQVGFAQAATGAAMTATLADLLERGNRTTGRAA